MPLWVLPQLSSVMWRHAELPDSYAFSLTGTLSHHFLLVLQCTLGKAPLDCIKAIDTEQRSWKKKNPDRGTSPYSTLSTHTITLTLLFTCSAMWYDLKYLSADAEVKTSETSFYTCCCPWCWTWFGKAASSVYLFTAVHCWVQKKSKSFTFSGAYIRSHQLHLTLGQFLKKFDIHHVVQKQSWI